MTRWGKRASAPPPGKSVRDNRLQSLMANIFKLSLLISCLTLVEATHECDKPWEVIYQGECQPCEVCPEHMYDGLELPGCSKKPILNNPVPATHNRRMICHTGDRPKSCNEPSPRFMNNDVHGENFSGWRCNSNIEYIYMSTCTLHCPFGMVKKDNTHDKIYCNENLAWDRYPAHCKDCSKLEDPHGKWNCSRDSSSSEGLYTCQLRCDHAVSIGGSSNVKCLGNFTWDQTPAQCLPPDCANKLSDAHGRWECLSQPSLKHISCQLICEHQKNEIQEGDSLRKVICGETDLSEAKLAKCKVPEMSVPPEPNKTSGPKPGGIPVTGVVVYVLVSVASLVLIGGIIFGIRKHSPHCRNKWRNSGPCRFSNPGGDIGNLESGGGQRQEDDANSGQHLLGPSEISISPGPESVINESQLERSDQRQEREPLLKASPIDPINRYRENDNIPEAPDIGSPESGSDTATPDISPPQPIKPENRPEIPNPGQQDYPNGTTSEPIHGDKPPNDPYVPGCINIKIDQEVHIYPPACSCRNDILLNENISSPRKPMQDDETSHAHERGREPVPHSQPLQHEDRVSIPTEDSIEDSTIPSTSGLPSLSSITSVVGGTEASGLDSFDLSGRNSISSSQETRHSPADQLTIDSNSSAENRVSDVSSKSMTDPSLEHHTSQDGSCICTGSPCQEEGTLESSEAVFGGNNQSGQTMRDLLQETCCQKSSCKRNSSSSSTDGKSTGCSLELQYLASSRDQELLFSLAADQQFTLQLLSHITSHKENKGYVPGVKWEDEISTYLRSDSSIPSLLKELQKRDYVYVSELLQLVVQLDKPDLDESVTGFCGYLHAMHQDCSECESLFTELRDRITGHESKNEWFLCHIRADLHPGCCSTKLCDFITNGLLKRLVPQDQCNLDEALQRLLGMNEEHKAFLRKNCNGNQTSQLVGLAKALFPSLTVTSLLSSILEGDCQEGDHSQLAETVRQNHKGCQKCENLYRGRCVPGAATP